MKYLKCTYLLKVHSVYIYMCWLSCFTFCSPSVAASNNTSGGGGESSDGGSGTAKPPGSALVQWTEVPHFPGMVCSLSQSTSTPVVMFFKPDVILVHELRALSSKSKVRKGVVRHLPRLPVASSCNNSQ